MSTDVRCAVLGGVMIGSAVGLFQVLRGQIAGNSGMVIQSPPPPVGNLWPKML